MPNATGDSFAPDLAIELIEDWGVQETWNIAAIRPYDVTEGEQVEVQPVAVTLTVTPPLQYKKDFFDNDVKIKEVAYCFIRGDVQFTPRHGQTVTINSKEWRVLKVDPLYSGRRIAAYAIYLQP